jgi:hypothetical protein
LNAELLSHDSATLTLDRWCAAHRLASSARIVAERAAGGEQAPTDEQRQLLGVSATEPVRYRRVRLICGGHVLSEADNWYRLLDTTDIAFGRAVQALDFRRQTLSAKLLWPPAAGLGNGRPLPERRGATLTIPPAVLQHRAVLSLPDGTPFSEVVETYTREVLAFPEPQGP